MSARAAWLVAIAVVAVVIAFAPDPIAQDPRYHDFADRRAWLGIPNAVDVLSNLPLALVGAVGLLRLRRQAAVADPHAEARRGFPGAELTVFFVGMLGAGFGSAYYHLHPDNARLVWDRLPIAIACMGLLCFVIGQRVGFRTGRRVLWPLVLFAAASVGWWALTEARGHGDLRPYGLAQFFPALALPVLLWPPRRGDATATAVWCALAGYAAAKLAEHCDTELFALGHVVSGHTLKHLLAAAGTAALLRLAR